VHQQSIKAALHVSCAQDAQNVNCDSECRTAPEMYQEVASITPDPQNATGMVVYDLRRSTKQGLERWRA